MFLEFQEGERHLGACLDAIRLEWQRQGYRSTRFAIRTMGSTSPSPIGTSVSSSVV